MKTIILCAGYATRLYPLTKNQPKALLDVGGKSILDHIVGKVELVADVDEIIVVSNDRFYSDFLKWKDRYTGGKKVHVVNDRTTSNEDRLGAIGDLHFVLENKKIDDDVLLIAGDNLFDFSLVDCVQHSFLKGGSVVALFDVGDVSKAAKKYGVAQIDEHHKIIDFEEKPDMPKSSLAATCCYVLRRESVAKIGTFVRERKADNTGDFIAWLSAHEDVYGFSFVGKWFDIGCHECLESAKEWYM